MSGELKTGEAYSVCKVIGKSPLHISILTVQKAYAITRRWIYRSQQLVRVQCVSAQNQDFYLEEQQKKIEEHFTDAIEVARASGISLDKLTQFTDTFISGGRIK